MGQREQAARPWGAEEALGIRQSLVWLHCGRGILFDLGQVTLLCNPLPPSSHDGYHIAHILPWLSSVSNAITQDRVGTGKHCTCLKGSCITRERKQAPQCRCLMGRVAEAQSLHWFPSWWWLIITQVVYQESVITPQTYIFFYC